MSTDHEPDDGFQPDDTIPDWLRDESAFVSDPQRVQNALPAVGLMYRRWRAPAMFAVAAAAILFVAWWAFTQLREESQPASSAPDIARVGDESERMRKLIGELRSSDPLLGDHQPTPEVKFLQPNYDVFVLSADRDPQLVFLGVRNKGDR